MPLVWKLDAANGLMVAVAHGDGTRLEMDSYLDARIQGGALAYGKVFDVQKADTSMTAVRGRAARSRSKPGA